LIEVKSQKEETSDFKKKWETGGKRQTLIRGNSGPTPVARGFCFRAKSPPLAARPITVCPLDEVRPLINTLSSFLQQERKTSAANGKPFHQSMVCLCVKVCVRVCVRTRAHVRVRVWKKVRACAREIRDSALKRECAS